MAVLVAKSLQQATLRWSEACDVVRLHPARRSYRKTTLGATGKLPGGREISTIEGRLGGGEVGVGDVALAAIGHGKLVVGVGNFRIGQNGGAQVRDRFVGKMGVIGGNQRLAEEDADQRRVRRERNRPS